MAKQSVDLRNGSLVKKRNVPSLQVRLASSFATLQRPCNSRSDASGICAGARLFPHDGSRPREDDVVEQTLQLRL